MLLAYLLTHCLVCIYAFSDGPGLGNIARSYMNASWGLIFGLAFYWYGSTKHLHTGLVLFYLGLLIRIPLGVYNIWRGGVLFVPGINFALDEQDIRFSASMLMTIAGLLCVFGRNPLARTLNGVIALAAGGTWFWQGGSRGQLLLTMALVGTLALIFRWRVFLASAAAGVLVLAATLNLAPAIVEPLPYMMQRSLTAFMVNSTDEVEIQGEVRGSSAFRAALWAEGYKRWSESARTITVGTGVKPFDDMNAAATASFEMEAFSLMVRNGADVGVYETAFWSMLAVTGVVGFALFFAAFFSVFGRLVRGLRTLPLEGAGKVFAAWGAGALVCCYLLCFVGGSFPSFELFLGMLGLSYIEDVRAAVRKQRKAEAPPAALPVHQPELVPA